MAVKFVILFNCKHTAVFPPPGPEELDIMLCRKCNAYKYALACTRWEHQGGADRGQYVVQYGARQIEKVKSADQPIDKQLELMLPAEKASDGLYPLPWYPYTQQ